MNTPNTEPSSQGLELYITPQNSCNLRCDFCCNRHVLDDPNRLSDDVLYRKLLPLYEKADRIWVIGGEITILPEMKQYLRFLGENYPAVNLAVVTNGTHFDEEWQQLCVEFDVAVRWSINAGDESAYERSARTPDARRIFRKVVGNLLEFDRMKTDAGKPYPRPSITNVLTHHSADDLASFFRFACEHRFPLCVYAGLEGEWISDTDDVPDDDWHLEANRRLLEMKLMFEEYIPMQVEHLANRFYEQAKREAVARIAIDGDAVRNDYAVIAEVCHGTADEIRHAEATGRATANKRPLPAQTIEIDGTEVCPRPWNYIALNPDGSVTPCCRRIRTLGNINEQTIEEIMHSEDARELRARMLAGKYDHCWGSCERNLNPDSSYAHVYRQELVEHKDIWFDGAAETKRALEQHFFEFKLNALHEKGVRRLAVYGAGAHTRRLLLVPAVKRFDDIRIVDDNTAAHGQLLCGCPVTGMQAAQSAGFDTLLISSDAHEAALFRRAKEMLSDNATIECLYKLPTHL
jgi:radical SAM protein with 4Fe4S-binding SPASM domain